MDGSTLAEPGTGSAPPEGPVMIEVRALEKAFRIPSHRIDSLKERVVHPFAGPEYRELQALQDVSFDVRRGEFFGVVGRNGSGKSTLLKVLASIYRADAGTIRMGGSVAPFIELGVGFNHDLSARENVILNGVMMGLSRGEAARRLDAVLDFAELRDFVDLKLKNYSSGMLVRLAFSLMIQSDAQILLIDEVLAVGDASFQQKCADEFHEMRDAGRTIVLVTHDMGAVQRYCHRAMLLDGGELAQIGEPEEVVRSYLRLNFERVAGEHRSAPEEGGVADLHARLVDGWLENEAGERVANVEEGAPIRLSAVVEARAELASPLFGLACANEDGVTVFEFNRALTLEDGQPDHLVPGQLVRFSGTIQNPLAPGRYFLRCWVARSRNYGDLALQALDLLDFVVYGSGSSAAVVSVQADFHATPQEGQAP